MPMLFIFLVDSRSLSLLPSLTACNCANACLAACVQDTCASVMQVGINIFKLTDNLTESEPHMTSGWKGFKRGQPFEVPLHNSNQQQSTFSTGLVRIQPDFFGKGFVDFFNRLTDPAFPIMDPGTTAYTANGCPLSLSAHRTYHIRERGDYLLETSSASPLQSCNSFNVRMECSSGAETASTADSVPKGFSVVHDRGYHRHTTE